MINIITDNPLHDSVNTVTAHAGTQSLAGGDVVTTVRSTADSGLTVAAGGLSGA